MCIHTSNWVDLVLNTTNFELTMNLQISNRYQYVQQTKDISIDKNQISSVFTFQGHFLHITTFVKQFLIVTSFFSLQRKLNCSDNPQYWNIQVLYCVWYGGWFLFLNIQTSLHSSIEFQNNLIIRYRWNRSSNGFIKFQPQEDCVFGTHIVYLIRSELRWFARCLL